MSGLIPTSSVSNSLLLLEDKIGQWENELNKDAEKTSQEKIATSKAEARRQIAHIRWQIAEMRSKPFQANIDSISNLFKQLETAQQGFSKGNEQYRKNKLEVMASNNAMQGKIDHCTFNFNQIRRKASLQEEKAPYYLNISAKKEIEKKYTFGPEKELKKCLAKQMQPIPSYEEHHIAKQMAQQFANKTFSEAQCEDKIKIVLEKIGVSVPAANITGTIMLTHHLKNCTLQEIAKQKLSPHDQRE